MINWYRLKARQLKRFPMRLLLRDLVSWEPLRDAEPGYTVVIACMGALAPLAVANMRLAMRQVKTRMHELILVFDCPVADIPEIVHEGCAEFSGSTRIQILGYSDWQHFVARKINWGWVYSWLSWSLAIARSRTRALVIHDLDALPIHERLFESLYDNWLEEGAEFCGISRYRGNGVTEQMNLARTPELVVDAHYLRERFRPIDLFNKLSLVDGRVVDFDTLLYVQTKAGRCAVRAIDEANLIHPSQVICNYTDFVSGRASFEGATHSLLVLAYLLYLGGDSTMLSVVTAQLTDGNAMTIRLFDKDLYIDGIPPTHWAWNEKLIRRAEQALFGRCRPEVLWFLAGFISRAGNYRTVGREKSASGVDDL
jgi:hypothetical protein